MTSKTCFVIAPIGTPDSEERRRSDQVLRHVIGPAVREKGYEPVRADQIAEPGLITSQVIQHVVDDPLVIADLTGRNPNVFYELALRHAIRKPLVQLIKKGEQIPFDVAAMRTISVDHHDLDSVEEAKREIVKQIEAAEAPDGKLETPISVALDLQSLRQSDDPERRSLAEALATLSEIRTGLASIDKKIDRMHGISLRSRRFQSTLLGRSEVDSGEINEKLRQLLEHHYEMRAEPISSLEVSVVEKDDNKGT